MPIPKQSPQAEEVSIHHANDKAFKTVFQIKEEAITYLKNFYPSLLSYLNLDVFELDNTNYVNKDFEEFFSDVVYRTQLKKTMHTKKQDVAVALLFEHKKSISSYFHLFLQLLEYIIFIWKQDLAHKRKPSIIVPIVVFQGKGGLKVKQLHDCFKGIPKELLKYMPNFEFYLTNVQPLATEKILAIEPDAFLRSLFLAYKGVEDKELLSDVVLEIFSFFKHKPNSIDFFQQIFGFVAQEGYLSTQKIENVLEHYLSPKQKQGMMTTAQQWKQEARREGLQEGRQEGRQENARLMLLRGKWKGASIEFLADLSELPYTEVANLLEEYDKIHTLWQQSKGKKVPTIETKYLTAQEVKYILDLFAKE